MLWLEAVRLHIAPQLLLTHNYEMSTITTTTSIARPDNPSAGDIHFETDTKNYVVYDGAAWRSYGGRGRCVDLFDTELALLSSKPDGSDETHVVAAYATDTNKFMIHDGNAWYLYNND